jgi:hypothetical protein
MVGFKGIQLKLKKLHISVQLLFAFSRQQSCQPKALESLFDTPPPLPDFFEIGY